MIDPYGPSANTTGINPDLDAAVRRLATVVEWVNTLNELRKRFPMGSLPGDQKVSL